MEKPSEVNLNGEVFDPVPNEDTGDAAWSVANMILSPSLEDADPVALRIDIQELQVENEDLLARRAGNPKSQMNTLLKLCSENKKVVVMKWKVKRLTQQLAEVRAAQETDPVGKQATDDAVAANDIAEKQVVAMTEEPLGGKTTHTQELHPRDAEVELL